MQDGQNDFPFRGLQRFEPIELLLSPVLAQEIGAKNYDTKIAFTNPSIWKRSTFSECRNDPIGVSMAPSVEVALCNC